MEIRLRLIGIGLACLVLGVPSTVSAGLSRAPNNLGLVGYWSFNEGTGLKAGDYSGQGNTGTLTNGPIWGAGKFGGGLTFDGTDDYVGTNLIPTSYSSITISAWVNMTAVGTYPMVVSYGGIASSVLELRGYASTGRIECANKGNNASSIDTLNIVGTGWHHVVCTGNGSAVALYRDGIAVDTDAIPHFINAASAISIGQRFPLEGGSFPFAGSLDDVRIYNRAVGANEVARLYNSGGVAKVQSAASEAGTGLIGHWKLDDRAGTRAIDSSQYANHGTLTSFALAGATSNWISGRLAGAGHFDGSNDYIVSQAAPALSSNPNVSMSAWVKLVDSSGGMVVSVGNAGSGCMPISCLLFAVSGTNIQTCPDEVRCIGATTTISPGQWYHVAFTKTSGDLTSLKMYINGVEQTITSGNLANGVALPASTLAYIGSNLGSGTSFDGAIDDVRIYNRALTAQEIKNLYTSGTSRPAIANANSASLTAGTNLASGLVGHWSFDGKYLSTTVARDSSGQGNNGTITGAVPIMGRLGQAMSFNGSTSKVATTSQLDQNGEMAISVWVKMNSTGNANIIGNNPSSGADFDYAMWVNYGGTNKISFGWESSPYIRVTTASTLSQNTWYHVAAVRSGSSGDWTARIYVNGVLDNTATGITVNPNATNQNTTIGAPNNWSGSFFFNGSLDDVRVYNRALSAQEVKQLYYLGK